jgi:hypothetical protein
MKFEMEVNMNNIAFDDGSVYSNELLRILEEVKESLEQGSICRSIRDINGNHVGVWAIKDD